MHFSICIYITAILSLVFFCSVLQHYPAVPLKSNIFILFVLFKLLSMFCFWGSVLSLILCQLQPRFELRSLWRGRLHLVPELLLLQQEKQENCLPDMQSQQVGTFLASRTLFALLFLQFCYVVQWNLTF